MIPLPQTLGLVLLSLCLCADALAQPRRPPPPPLRAPLHHRHHDNYDWVAPLFFIGIAGSLLANLLSQRHQPDYQDPPLAPNPTAPAPVPPTYPPVVIQPVPPVVVQSAPPVVRVPPAPPTPPANANYYCRSVGQYYPTTSYCPEGWQLVVPSP